MMIKNQIHGFIALMLGVAAIGLGLTAVVIRSPWWGWMYAMSIILLPLLICYSYCAKCVCRLTCCGHVMPGWLTRYLPSRKPGKYTAWDLCGTFIPMGFLVLFPQYWLWQQREFGLIFWGLLFLALLQVRLWVCPACQNRICPVLPNKY
ncbi:hypothetical protein JW933_08700 [candidate division FCPU426 bacterium]|nr:hypothetical protein [candidate division FCPU426 bacterium]